MPPFSTISQILNSLALIKIRSSFMAISEGNTAGCKTAIMLVSVFRLFFLSLLLEGQNWCNSYSYKQSPTVIKIIFQISLQEMWHCSYATTTVEKPVLLFQFRKVLLLFSWRWAHPRGSWLMWFWGLVLGFFFSSKDSHSYLNTRGICIFYKYFLIPILLKCCPHFPIH